MLQTVRNNNGFSPEQPSMKIITTLAALTFLLPSVVLAESKPAAIIYVKDIQVDGPVSQWKSIDPIGNWNNPSNIVYGKNNWTGPSDLGGTGWMGWDEHSLYLAANITDDQVRQSGSGENIWQGDHVMVLLNLNPDPKAPAGRFNQAGQFMLGLSPGSLGHNAADLLSNLPPEVYVWQPQYVGNSGIALTAKKTDTGYLIQAAIPWTFLGAQPHNGMKVDFDLCPSDCDTQEMQQQTLASLIPGAWDISTGRLIHGELQGGPQGAAHTPSTGPKIELSKQEIKLKAGGSRQFTFEQPANTNDLKPVLSLNARLDFKELGGASYALTALVNGQRLTPERCINRPLRATFASGQSIGLFQSNIWTLFYSPDYKAINTDTQSGYYIPPNQLQGYTFKFNVDGLLKDGTNTITIRDDADATQTQAMAFEDLVVQWVPAAQAKKHEVVEKPRPPVSVRPPKELSPPADAALDNGGAIRFKSAARAWTIESQFSEPNGQWAKLNAKRDSSWSKFTRESATKVSASTAQFTLERQIKPVGQCLEIHEKLINLTDQKLPIMVRHQLSLPQSDLETLTLNGRPMPLKRGITSDAQNPTILLKTKEGGGVALAPRDGVFRLHHQAFYLNDTAGLADSSLVLAPHATYEQVWQVYAVPSGDYWDLVNAIRSQWDNNFTVNGPFAFIDPRVIEGRNLQGDLTPEQMKQWLEVRNVGIPAIDMYDPATNAALQGLANTLDSHYVAKVTRLVDMIHQIDPKLPVIRYFHCFITGTPFNKDADPADALLNSTGQPVYYSTDKHWPIYVPTATNQYGRQMTQLAKDLVQKLHLNGLYWDEEQYSDQLYDYGKDWDGVSGDIDRNTHQLIRTKSLVPLISAKLRYEIMDWLLDNHMTVVCNGQPMTPAEEKYKVHRFVETGSITNLYDTNLFSPTGLADFLTERTHADVMRSQRQFLNYGALYDYYESNLPIENPGLCRWMYPTTPIALGPGYVLGKERILTNRSGRFSWGDKTLPPLDVHEIDAMGNIVKANWKKVTADGIEWVELQLPVDHAAAIVRK
jgi:hypothetical protein